MQRLTVSDQRVTHDLLDRQTTLPLTNADGGTAQFYIRALTGVNVDKWYNGVTDDWQANKVSAGEGEHKDRGAWELELTENPLELGTRYEKGCEHSLGTQIDYREELIIERVLGGYSSTTPVTALVVEGTFTLYAGDDYLAVDGRDLVVTLVNYSGPSLMGATVVMRVLSKEDYDADVVLAVVEVEATATSDDADMLLSVELTAADTVLLQPSPPDNVRNYRYQFVATLSTTSVVTLAEGSMTVKKGLEAPEA